ncbi:MAG: tRNA (adenosine(37)-N6)-threonylcarbamoyltransferase complex ATPase subunit type 1 TsaE [Sphingobacteriaceae bacterium]|nr:tRNA (adenosine(37)-N6)-threonylcarbamoyltransferase complex ATPase subunit type 1 TsaE [Sphingobacteriaceae bacterium]
MELSNIRLDLDELPKTADLLLQMFSKQKVFIFAGEMGSGKTTFIKALCERLGSKNSFSSPTFSLVNEYNYSNGKIYHFDLYRIKSEEELLDIGFAEYLESDNYCFIEWPELALPLIHEKIVRVHLKQNDNIHYLSAIIE